MFKRPLSETRKAAMQRLANFAKSVKNEKPSSVVSPGVGKVAGPQKSFPDNILVPDVKSGGSLSIGPDGTPQFSDNSTPVPSFRGSEAFKKGGKVKSTSSANHVSKGSMSKASRRADGIAQRGKTKGRII